MSDISDKARVAVSRLNNSAWARDIYAALDLLDDLEKRADLSKQELANEEVRKLACARQRDVAEAERDAARAAIAKAEGKS